MKLEVTGHGERAVLEIEENEHEFHIDGGDGVRTFTLLPVAGDRFVFACDGDRSEMDIVADGDAVRVTCGPDVMEFLVRPHLPVQRRGAGLSSARRITAPMPGLVADVRVRAGEAVSSDQAVVILEAMKMQMELRAPAAGVVRRVAVHAGQEVGGGALLAEIETSPEE
jgi:3-methylcrotonyl-CoA carboxylase alpha subunit